MRLVIPTHRTASRAQRGQAAQVPSGTQSQAPTRKLLAAACPSGSLWLHLCFGKLRPPQFVIGMTVTSPRDVGLKSSQRGPIFLSLGGLKQQKCVIFVLVAKSLRSRCWPATPPLTAPRESLLVSAGSWCWPHSLAFPGLSVHLPVWSSHSILLVHF